MVDKIADPLRDIEYCIIFFGTDDAGRIYRYTWVPVCGYTRYTDTCELFFWECGGRIYDSDSSDPDHGEFYPDGTGDHRLLYSEDLRGSKMSPALYHFEKNREKHDVGTSQITGR